MKLIRFGIEGKEKPGIMLNGIRKDCSDFFLDWNSSFFRENGIEKLQKLIQGEGENLPDVPEDNRWGSPIARPGMIMCIGLNFADHAAESGADLPKEPVLFMKATNTLSGPYDNVGIPKGSTKTDWEVELGIVLRKDISYLENEAEAEESIAGYVLVHDISERSFQLERGGNWVKGKSCPGFSPVGPYLVSKDEIKDILDLNLNLSVNGQEMQKGNTRNMIFNPSYIVWYLSQFMKLEAGDIISTGTPPGVGMGKKPPVYLKKGDKVILSADFLGRQQQNFI